MSAITSSNQKPTSQAMAAQMVKPTVAVTKVSSYQATSTIAASPKVPAAVKLPPAGKVPTAGKESDNKNPASVVALQQKLTHEPRLYTQTGRVDTQVRAAPSSAKPTQAKEELGVSSEAASGNSFIAGAGDVVVDIKNSDSGYENKIFWSSDNFNTRHYIGVDNVTGSFNLGKFAEGTRIDFGIENGANQFFRTGAASENADGIEHATATKTDAGTEIGFEDLYGGGDRDFNDAIINVRNVASAPVTGIDVQPKVDPKVESKVEPKTTPKVEPRVDSKVESKVEPKVTPKVEAKVDSKVESKVEPKVMPKVEPKVDSKVESKVEPKVTPKVESKVDPKLVPKTTNNNRSGLGDGTNPGQGAGKDKATNQGTNNPNKIEAYLAKPMAASRIMLAV